MSACRANTQNSRPAANPPKRATRISSSSAGDGKQRISIDRPAPPMPPIVQPRDRVRARQHKAWWLKEADKGASCRATFRVWFSMSRTSRPQGAAAVADALVVNCSPTAKSLPIRVGLQQAVFARFGLDVRLVSTENSREQRTGLARGDFQVVHVAVDNAIAMREVDQRDVVVLMGGDSGMNELFVQSHIRSIAEIRGGRLVVDAPDTAFALQAYKIFEDHGLARGRDYQVVAVGRGELRIAAMRADKAKTAAILNLPYSLEARRSGLRSLGDTTQWIGPYQAARPSQCVPGPKLIANTSRATLRPISKACASSSIRAIIRRAPRFLSRTSEPRPTSPTKPWSCCAARALAWSRRRRSTRLACAIQLPCGQASRHRRSSAIPETMSIFHFTKPRSRSPNRTRRLPIPFAAAPEE